MEETPEPLKKAIAKAYDEAKKNLRQALDKNFEDLSYLAAKLVVEFYEFANEHGVFTEDEKLLPEGQLEQLARGDISVKDAEAALQVMKAAEGLSDELEEMAEEPEERFRVKSITAWSLLEPSSGEPLYQATVTHAREDCDGGKTLWAKVYVNEGNSTEYSRDDLIAKLMGEILAHYPGALVKTEFSPAPLWKE